jgi:hypothetical protein
LQHLFIGLKMLKQYFGQEEEIAHSKSEVSVIQLEPGFQFFPPPELDRLPAAAHISEVSFRTS